MPGPAAGRKFQPLLKPQQQPEKEVHLVWFRAATSHEILQTALMLQLMQMQESRCAGISKAGLPTVEIFGKCSTCRLTRKEQWQRVI
jgi:hypothetical protein